MLYPTHKRYGILFGLGMIPIGVWLGLIPILSVTMRSTDIAMIVICSYMGMRGAMFGAEFPDIDSPSSIPSKRHPLIAKIFRFFNVKHRGKFSHDVFSQTALFGGIFFILTFASNRWLNSMVDGSQVFYGVTVLATLCFVWFIAVDLVDFFKWAAELGRSNKILALLSHNRFKIGLGIAIVLTILLVWNGVIDLFGVILFDVSLESALKSGMILVASFKLYIIFALAGVYSHLFADMTTKSGISIFFIDISPAKVILKAKKIPLVGKLLVPTEFKTGSKWEDFNRMVVTILCIPAVILALGAIVGFDLSGLFGGHSAAQK